MIKFMLGVLGSSIFWFIYFVCTLFIGTILFRHIFPNVFEFFTTGSCEKDRHKDPDDEKIGYFEVTLACMYIYTCWPLICVGYIIAFSIKILFAHVFRNLVIYANKLIPEFKIVKK